MVNRASALHWWALMFVDGIQNVQTFFDVMRIERERERRQNEFKMNLLWVTFYFYVTIFNYPTALQQSAFTSFICFGPQTSRTMISVFSSWIELIHTFSVQFICQLNDFLITNRHRRLITGYRFEQNYAYGIFRSYSTLETISSRIHRFFSKLILFKAQ